MHKRYLAAICVGLSALGPLLAQAAEGTKDDYLFIRAEAIRLYSASASSDLMRLCEQSRRGYRDTGGKYFLFRAAALAELAGPLDLKNALLLEILNTQREGAGFLFYCVETFRARGTLSDNIDAVLAAAGRLPVENRLETARVLARAYEWRPPPGGVEKLVREQLDAKISGRDLVYFAWILSGWGHPDEAVELLVERGLAADTALPDRSLLVAALSRLGAAPQARRVAEEAISRFLPGVPPDDIPLADLLLTRQSRYSRLAEIAMAGAAWDVLLAKTASAAEKDAHARILDRAVSAEAAGMPVEAAEYLEGLRKAKPGANADALYAGALARAGDAFTARGILLATVTRAPHVGEDAYFDLLDTLVVLRDARTLESFATIYSLAFGQPQHARAMTEWLRALGAYPASDRLYRTFIKESGLGAGTRFAWQGGRLLAIYFLETGRLEEGRKAAWEALEHLLLQQNLQKSTRSSAPERFVELFARFGGVGDLYDYCRKRESEFPDGILLRRIEQAALEHLGRWQEAMRTQEALVAGFDPVSRDLHRASAHVRAGRFEEAARHYENAMAAEANVPRAGYMELVRVHAELGRWGEVESHFSKLAAARGPNAWLELGSLMARYGQTSRALRAYARLDDLAVPVAADELGAAVHFWVGSGEIETAAAALARRIGVQETFDAKIRYVNHSLPSASALAAGYLELGERLQKGPMAADRRLLAHFHRELGRRLERVLDPLRALAAYRAARDLEPENPENHLLICFLASRWRPYEARAAAADLVARIPDTSVVIERICADLALGNREDAADALTAVLEGPLKISQIARIVEVFESFNVPRAVLEKAAGRAGQGWPWVLRARLGDVALEGGHEESALGAIGEVEKGGRYVGRALWSAGNYSRLDLAERAAGALADYTAAAGAHPAAALLEADFALAEGSPQKARNILAGARTAFSVEPIKRLFQRELQRLPYRAGGVEGPEETP